MLNGLADAASLPWLFMRSAWASAEGRAMAIPGRDFARFGRRLGFRALLRGQPIGIGLMLTPVHIVRYWEFPFVLRHLETPLEQCLDVGSPRLFSLYMAATGRASHIQMLNPDGRDALATKRLASVLGLSGIEVAERPVSSLDGAPRRFQAIWSISVVEHIDGDGDIEAMKLMYGALSPGGRLLVTVPVDRQSWLETRDMDVYHLRESAPGRSHFFQRWYDEPSIQARLIQPVQPNAVSVEWFGESTAGRFAAYEQDWIRRGYRRSVDDPVEIGTWYRSFDSWADMPGQGVCGISMAKNA